MAPHSWQRLQGWRTHRHAAAYAGSNGSVSFIAGECPRQMPASKMTVQGPKQPGLCAGPSVCRWIRSAQGQQSHSPARSSVRPGDWLQRQPRADGPLLHGFELATSELGRVGGCSLLFRAQASEGLAGSGPERSLRRGCSVVSAPSRHNCYCGDRLERTGGTTVPNLPSEAGGLSWPNDLPAARNFVERPVWSLFCTRTPQIEDWECVRERHSAQEPA